MIWYKEISKSKFFSSQEVKENFTKCRPIGNYRFVFNIIGKSKASEILNRKRRLTLSMIRKLNRTLGIPAETLIKEYELVK